MNKCMLDNNHMLSDSRDTCSLIVYSSDKLHYAFPRYSLCIMIRPRENCDKKKKKPLGKNNKIGLSNHQKYLET